MIRFALAASLFAVAAPALAVERNYAVPGFDKLSLEGSQLVTVSTGHGTTVRASGDPEALDHLNIRVEDGTLKIGGKRGGFNWEWRDHRRPDHDHRADAARRRGRGIGRRRHRPDQGR